MVRIILVWHGATSPASTGEHTPGRVVSGGLI